MATSLRPVGSAWGLALNLVGPRLDEISRGAPGAIGWRPRRWDPRVGGCTWGPLLCLFACSSLIPRTRSLFITAAQPQLAPSRIRPLPSWHACAQVLAFESASAAAIDAASSDGPPSPLHAANGPSSSVTFVPLRAASGSLVSLASSPEDAALTEAAAHEDALRVMRFAAPPDDALGVAAAEWRREAVAQAMGHFGFLSDPSADAGKDAA